MHSTERGIKVKLSISNIAWNDDMNSQVYKLMQKYNYSGLEIAPTRIFPQQPYERLIDAEKWSFDLMQKYGFLVSSMQSIWFGRNEKLFGTEQERKVLFDYTKKAIDFAAAIGCKNLVFGCPRNRNMPEGADKNTAVSFFRELGDYAEEKGTVIGMEANPPIYNTNFINSTSSALELIKEVNSKGFLLNLDIGTMIHNAESISSLSGQVKYINHIHISEPGLKRIQKRSMHKELNQLLNTEGYKGYVSIEMEKQNTVSDIEEIMNYIKEVFKVC